MDGKTLCTVFHNSIDPIRCPFLCLSKIPYGGLCVINTSVSLGHLLNSSCNLSCDLEKELARYDTFLARVKGDNHNFNDLC